MCAVCVYVCACVVKQRPHGAIILFPSSSQQLVLRLSAMWLPSIDRDGDRSVSVY